jgi:hypothetical protein
MVKKSVIGNYSTTVPQELPYLWTTFAFSSPILFFMDQDDRHRVYMSFMDRHGWQCQFLEADLKTPLPKRLHFASPDKIIELVERGGGFKDQESRLMLDQGIAMGRGGVYLSLTDDQYAKLKKSR